MKKRITIALFLCVYVYGISELNYKQAVDAAIASEGTDASIEDIMHRYGFRTEVYEYPSVGEKIAALVRSN